MRQYNRIFKESWNGPIPSPGQECGTFVKEVLSGSDRWEISRIVFNTYLGNEQVCAANLNLKNKTFKPKFKGNSIEFESTVNDSNISFTLFLNGLTVKYIGEQRDGDFKYLECFNNAKDTIYVIILTPVKFIGGNRV